jgi:hypothetical protein
MLIPPIVVTMDIMDYPVTTDSAQRALQDMVATHAV